MASMAIPGLALTGLNRTFGLHLRVREGHDARLWPLPVDDAQRYRCPRECLAGLCVEDVVPTRED